MPYRPKPAAYQATTDDSSQDQENVNSAADDWTPELSGEASVEQDKSNQPQDYGSYYEPSEDYNTNQSFAGFVGIKATCTNCTKHFPSKTKLHKHLRTGCRANKVNTGSVNSLPVNLAEAQVIELTASQEGVGSGSAYRAWNFAEAQVMFSPEATGAAAVYIDTGCGVTLYDK